MADDVILWPLRAVSKDPTNLTKLDADNTVLTSTTDVDARYVTKAGDTMTGRLIVSVPSQSDIMGQIQITGESVANITMTSCGDPNNGAGQGINFRSRRSRGTLSAPSDVQSGDIISGYATQAYFSGAYRSCGSIQYRVDAVSEVGDAVARTGFSVFTSNGISAALPVIVATSQKLVGINWTTPTHQLEVGGDAIVRGPLEVTGNITTAGTAHSFAAGSIPTSALGGAFGALTASTVSATGGRSNFAPLGEPFAIGFRYNAAGLPNYIGTASNGDFQVSSSGGVSILSINSTGNITNTGTAHSFANGSIPSPAVIGNTPRTIAATGSAGSAGQMVWDDNFIYLRTTGGWKKVALTAI
jgi:hypothetical protein